MELRLRDILGTAGLNLLAEPKRKTGAQRTSARDKRDRLEKRREAAETPRDSGKQD